MQPAQSETSQWWRWPLVPFASVLGALLGSVIITALQWFGMKMQGGFEKDGWYYLYVLPVFSAGVFGYLYAYIAGLVAPRGKLITGVVMTTLLFAIIAFGSVLTWAGSRYSIGESVQSTIGTVATLAGSVIALMQIHEEGG